MRQKLWFLLLALSSYPLAIAAMVYFMQAKQYGHVFFIGLIFFALIGKIDIEKNGQKVFYYKGIFNYDD